MEYAGELPATPIEDDAENFLITIDVNPQAQPPVQTLDQLYGILADIPMPEIADASLD
jgi:hypothetical protein